MLQTKHLLSAATLFVFVILAIASSGIKRMSFTPEGVQIPPEFNRFKDTLLVIKHPEEWGYDHYLKKNFANNYTGQYKIIKASELKSYPEATYRYVFDTWLNYSTTTTTTSNPVTGGGHVRNGASTTSTHSSTYTSSSVFLITDRQQKRDYVTKKSSMYSKLMRAYIKAIDAYRLK